MDLDSMVHYFVASIDKSSGGTTEYMRLLGTALIEGSSF
jgi:hypothetical protein